MASATAPTAAGMQITNGRRTAPMMQAGMQAGFAQAQAAAVTSGTATQYWQECLAYPPGSMASLWLYVDNGWRALDNPPASTVDTVQRAFLGSGSSVVCWYDGSTIVGLVVSGS